MPLLKKPLKMPLEKSKPYGQPYKDVLKKWTQIDALNQLKNKFRINDAVVDIGDL